MMDLTAIGNTIIRVGEVLTLVIVGLCATVFIDPKVSTYHKLEIAICLILLAAIAFLG